MYWATGLSPIYLEGALERALQPAVQRQRIQPMPAFDAPADTSTDEPSVPTPVDAILDPFSVYENAEAMLRNRLNALSERRL